MNVIKDVHMRPVLEMIDANKQVSGLQGQRDKHEQSINNINKLIKDLKANRHKTLKQIVGGNLIVDVDGKDAIKRLQDYKRELEIGMKSMDEQLMHRNDGLESAAIKTFKLLRKRLPKDVLEEIEKGE